MADEDDALDRAPSHGSYEDEELEDHEFGTQKAHAFASLGSRMRFVGIATLVLTVLSAWVSWPGGKRAGDGGGVVLVTWCLGIVIGLVVGVWTVQAAGAFKRIASTSGGDLMHLMEAVGGLTKLYTLQMISILLLIGLFGLTLALALAR